jgi:hypothetical protein
LETNIESIGSSSNQNNLLNVQGFKMNSSNNILNNQSNILQTQKPIVDLTPKLIIDFREEKLASNIEIMGNDGANMAEFVSLKDGSSALKVESGNYLKVI